MNQEREDFSESGTGRAEGAQQTQCVAGGFPAGRVVLVADDEPLALRLAERVLAQMGLEVVAVDDGAKAVELIERRREAIHAAVLDVSMPGTDGFEVCRCIRRFHPEIPVLFVTGYCGDDWAGRIEELRPSAVIRKPYLLSTLREEVARVFRDARHVEDTGKPSSHTTFQASPGATA